MNQGYHSSSTPPPHLIAWEITRTCNLLCAHCRASSHSGPYAGELTTAEMFSVIDGICQVGRPILILSGGEPLARPDFFDIAKRASAKGLRVALGCNGTLMTREIATRLKEVPIPRVSVSIDFPVCELQDRFRGMPGAFDAAIKGVQHLREAGVEIQINCTITKMNAPHLQQLLDLALELGAVAFHPFMLVPTGRGKNLASEELPPEEYERILGWICDRQEELKDRIFFKPTDAPHYWRIMLQKGKRVAQASLPARGGIRPVPQASSPVPGHPPARGMNSMTRGCLAGSGFCFISHTGRVQGCGYLDLEAGNVKEKSFKEIWEHSPLFLALRDLSLLKGKCGVCEFKKVCGGCRARAYESTGDVLDPEPYCIYEPRKVRASV
ncbi:MAG: radical SAM protein [Chloroflexi bacterium]|nr:radical SAM protein [Chloroflexota bacterium]